MMTTIVDMDNCSIHHIEPVLDAFNQAGIVVLFLPPYSPDVNPIENVQLCYLNNMMKQFLPDIRPLLQQCLDTIIGKDNIQQWITYCGY